MPPVRSDRMRAPGSRADGLPPGPSVPAPVQTLTLARDPLGVLSRCRGRFGPVFTLDLATVGPTVVLSDPEAAPMVVSSACAGEARRQVLPQASPHSSFGGEGGEWKAARGRLRHAFTRERLETFTGEMAAVAADHADALPLGRPILLLSRLRALTQAIFTRFVLGVPDAERADEISAAIGRVIRVPGNPPLTPPGADDGPLGRLVDSVLRERLVPLVELLDREIRERRARRGGPDGLLTDLALGEPERDPRVIVDELFVVLAAAQEPPSIAMTWVLERLSRESDLGLRFDESDDAGRAMIVDEVLRLRPPAMASLRTLPEPVPTGGGELPAGTSVMVPGLLLHREPALFDRPDEFRPDRFADGRPAAFIAFGGGPRSCPGESLARLQLAVVVPILRERIRLELPGRPERPVQRATVLAPHRSGLCVARCA